MPDTFKLDGFGADHYRPVKHFPHLATIYTNLFYACNACNARKSSHWPVGAEAATKTIPNPCDHVMLKHLRFKGEVVEAQSDSGLFTVKLLDLNRPAEVQIRETFVHMIRAAARELSSLQASIEKIKAEKKKGSIPGARADEGLAKLETLKARAVKTLSDLGASAT